jgi:hypothetical protein
MCLSCAGTALLIPHAATDLTFKNMEDSVFVMVDVQGRRVPLRGSVLKNRDAVRTVSGRDPDGDMGVEEPEVPVIGSFTVHACAPPAVNEYPSPTVRSLAAMDILWHDRNQRLPTAPVKRFGPAQRLHAGDQEGR